MAKPKDSRHSNRYQGNSLMIEKLHSFVGKLRGTESLTPEQERVRRVDAQFKRERKQQRRLSNVRR